MQYICVDFEWNVGLDKQMRKQIPNEIFEFGAVKMNEEGEFLSKFSQLVKPKAYQIMNEYTSNLVHVEMRDLQKSRLFNKVMKEFREWCGEEEFLFCTWDCMDLTELQRNMKFHHMAPLSEEPIAFLDVQKLYSIAYEDGKIKKKLEEAVDEMGMEKDEEFHRALADAEYTAEVLKRIMKEHPEVMELVSFDLYHPPKSHETEVKWQFSDHLEYISREFVTKQDAMEDHEVDSCKCYLCHRNLEKKIPWFTLNGKQQYCVAYCEEHGYLEAEIRFHKTEKDKQVVHKKIRFISEAEAEELEMQSAQAAEQRRLKALKKASKEEE